MKVSKLNVTVTQKDIKEGCDNNVSFCPIAMAVRRLGKTRIRVEDYIYTRNGVYEMPQTAMKFIDRFDNGRTVKPFKFVATRIA